MSIHTKKNYYFNLFLSVFILAILLIIVEVIRPSSLIVAISLFLFFTGYFFTEKRVEGLVVEGDKIMLTYFQFLKRFILSSELSSVKISNHSEISYRSPQKKFTLSISINGKKFKINTLDGFNEDDLISLYKFYSSHTDPLQPSKGDSPETKYLHS